jgi:oligoendopeptidase F
MNTTQRQTIPTRAEIPREDQWDLSRLFPDDDAWETALEQYKSMIPEIEGFRGTLGESARALYACLEYMTRVQMLSERLGYYAHLRLSEDGGDSSRQDRFSRYMQAATDAETAASYQTPEIQAIPDDTIKTFLEDPVLESYRVPLEKLLRYKPHVLSEAEERLLSMQEQSSQTASRSFGALVDVDIEYGEIETPDGPKPLTQSTFLSFMQSPDRNTRQTAYNRFMEKFLEHKNTLSSLYAGSVHLDHYKARVRNFPSCRAARLFPDKVPESVYDNLVDTVSAALPALHQYYALRKDVLGLDSLRLYDTKVPLVPKVHFHHTYDQAVELIVSALRPLGEEYCTTLEAGLSGGWVDRYENKGKRSGAFSAGSYLGDPYILMNYKEDVLRDVYTLAHEGGHSMHSWYSVRNNPFQYYDYTIFEAEVASTFNEQLLTRHLLNITDNPGQRAYILNKEIDELIGTFFRQTMFAEFEKITHQMVESGVSLTVDSVRTAYRNLLEKYFGPDVTIDDQDDIEGLRVPHFYRAFYVYKYATGISAAITLSQRVLNGGKQELEDYLSFLKSGGSRYPLESLRVAGVDMEKPEPVNNTVTVFRNLVESFSRELKEL